MDDLDGDVMQHLAVAFDDIVEAGMRATDLNDILNDALDRVMELEYLDAGAIYLLDRERLLFDLVVSRNVSEEFVQEVKHIQSDEQGLASLAAEGVQGKLVFPADSVLKSPGLPMKSISAAQKEGMNTDRAVAVLLVFKEIVGLMIVAGRNPLKLSGSTHLLLSLAGRRVAEAIEVHRLYRQTVERKRDLRESQDKYRVLVENAGEAILVGQDGMLKFFNPRLTRITGYSPEDLGSRPFVEFVHPEDREMVVENHGKRLKGEPLPDVYSFRIVDKHGNVRWVEINAVVISWEDRPATLTFLSDITNRKAAEDALKAGEARYHGLVENINDGYLVNRMGRIVFANARLAEMLGYRVEDMIGMHAEDILSPETREEVMELYNRRLANEEVVDKYQTCLLSASSRRVPAEISVRLADYEGVPAAHVIVRDITERLNAQEAEQKSSERFRLLAENARDLIFRMRLKPQPGFEYMSPSAVAITGYGPEEFYADPALGYRIIHPEDSDITETWMNPKEPLAKPIVLRCMHKDGGIVWTEQLINPVFDEAGDLVAVQGVVRDITERKNMEEALLKANDLLHKAVEGSVRAITTIAEMRDPYTAGHQQRVARLATSIAGEMSLSKEKVKAIHMAGLLHDIGKVIVPSEILSKPGKLSEIEMAMVRSHVEVSYNILKTIEFPWPICPIVHQHHERIDGSGYPSGLQGASITLEARILGVADVVEAMASHRPYRPALGMDMALEEISQKRGILYDVDVVDACLRVIKEKGFTFD
ncbi:MAG: PAS domain S-box protein [Pseudomonadota bacterium]